MYTRFSTKEMHQHLLNIKPVVGEIVLFVNCLLQQNLAGGVMSQTLKGETGKRKYPAFVLK